ncbi:MAG: reductive dehalogenase domain-containing protein [Dehalococcoidia bacterium]|jgi:Pyruvate/2-oxoacid:ferredoxin oxidoreductase delta subunit|nr:reductive dehalogenase domain-containing protein [Dehalococcoidia bacterium]
MGEVNVEGAQRPTRTKQEMGGTGRSQMFRRRMPASARRQTFLRRFVLAPARDALVNEARTEVDDVEAMTTEIKALVREMGAEAVGIAAYDPRLVFADAPERDHRHVIVFGLSMKYDCLIDIGPRSQAEVHRVYYTLDDMAVRLAQQIGSYGYSACAQPNMGDIPLPAYGYLAGLGELGKHGSLISPELGSSFRLVAVSTDLPLLVDGPKDHGIDEVCASCNVCTRFCPGDAIKPDKKEVNGVLRWHVDTPACQPWFYKMHGCKICLMVCPLNARGRLKAEFQQVAADIRQVKDAQGMVRLIEQRTGEEYADGDGNGDDDDDDDGGVSSTDR